jgi:hypothetical protein
LALSRLNVILSVLAFVVITVFLHVPLETPSSLSSKMKRIDWLGIALSILFVVLLLLALSWGGVKYAYVMLINLYYNHNSLLILILVTFLDGAVLML